MGVEMELISSVRKLQTRFNYNRKELLLHFCCECLQEYETERMSFLPL